MILILMKIIKPNKDQNKRLVQKTNKAKNQKLQVVILPQINQSWRKPPRKISYKRTFGTPDQGQTLDLLWESQTTESALGWRTRHIAPRHILELTLEVILEVILEYVLGIKTMTSSILDHIATAYLYLGINTRKKVMVLIVVIVLELSQDWSWSIKHALWSFLL